MSSHQCSCGLKPGGILPDHQIEARIKITPFVDPRYEDVKKAQAGCISYGLSSYGYDIRVGRRFKIFTNTTPDIIVDPKHLREAAFVDVEADKDHILIPPNGFALAEAVEYIEMPRDVLAICVGKSTYARAGVIVNVTPIEPMWRGIITLELSNTTPLPAKIYVNEGIAQLIFLVGVAECDLSYDGKKGKYQDQQGITLPFVNA